MMVELSFLLHFLCAVLPRIRKGFAALDRLYSSALHFDVLLCFFCCCFTPQLYWVFTRLCHQTSLHPYRLVLERNLNFFLALLFFLLRISMHVGECVSEEDVALHKRSSRPSRTFVFPLVFFSFVSFHFVQTVFRFVLANRFTALACWDNTHTHTC